MQYSVLKKSDLFYHHPNFRLDPEYYRPHILSILDIILSKKNYPISDIAVVTDGEHGSPKLDENSGIAYLSGQNIKENIIDLRNIRYCTKELHEKNLRSALKENNILVSIVGTVGNAAVVSKNILANTDRNVATIKNIDNKYNSFYVSSFLNSKYGKIQTKRGCAGNVQPIINLTELRLVRIPLLDKNFQLTIESLIKKSFDLSDQSKSLYSEAEDLLLEELGLKNWKPKHQLSYIKNYSETQKAERFDAEYFQPQYDEVIEKVKNIQNDDLGNIVKWSKGIEVGSEQYIDEGFDFIRISDFNIKGISKASKKISEELFLELKDKFSPKKGDILFTKDGTIGLTYLVNQDQKAIISGAFLKLRPKIDIEPEYLALVLNSIICKKQIEMMSGGAIIAHLKPSDAMKLQIPILSPKRQKEISLKLIDSKEKDKQSKSLLSIAKKAVEMAIETSEEQASKWIDQELEKLGVQLI